MRTWRWMNLPLVALLVVAAAAAGPLDPALPPGRIDAAASIATPGDTRPPRGFPARAWSTAATAEPSDAVFEVELGTPTPLGAMLNYVPSRQPY